MQHSTLTLPLPVALWSEIEAHKFLLLVAQLSNIHKNDVWKDRLAKNLR